MLKEAAVAKLRGLIGLAGQQRDPYVFTGVGCRSIFIMGGPQRSGLLRDLDEEDQIAWWLTQEVPLPSGTQILTGHAVPHISTAIVEWDPIFLGCVALWPRIRDTLSMFNQWPRCLSELQDWLPDEVALFIRHYSALNDAAEECES